MPKRIVIEAKQIEEIETARKKNKSKKAERRLKAILMYAHGKACEEIASATDYNEGYIYKLAAKYCKNGLEAIIGNHYKGNRRNMSFEEETELLKEFKADAEKGQIVSTGKIKEAYEKKTGKSLDTNKGQIYRVLKRHKWRQVMPRSKHPNKASDEVIEASKKLKLR